MMKPRGPSGFLVVDKPEGITSFDVIRELRRQLKIRKLGHSGVLDKPATGVLVVGVNQATRLFELFPAFEKEYTADIWLGLSTTTDDLTGELTSVAQNGVISRQAIEEALRYYSGTIDQIPPAFSLTKIGGKELYRYALAGENVEAEPKRVTVLNNQLIAYEPQKTLPHVPKVKAGEKLEVGSIATLTQIRVFVCCLGGFYVRSLARDIGADLGVGGVLGTLVRNRVGPFTLEQALSLNDIATHASQGNAPGALLLPLSAVAPEETRIPLDATQLNMVRNGRNIRRFKHALPPGAQKRGDLVFGMDPGNDLAAVLTVGTVNQHGLVELKPDKVFI